MPKFGTHAFVFVGEWTTDSGNFAIEQAGRHGFEYLEIPLLKPDEFDAAGHRAALKKHGLKSTCSLVLPKGTHMPAHPEQARAFLSRALQKVEELECTVLGGCIAYELGTLTGQPPTAQERQTVVEVLRDVAAEAQRRGITLALEACNRYETYLYNTLADARETVLAVGAPGFMVHADTYHMNIEENGFRTPIIEAGDVLGYIHMSESHRGKVGTGTVKWEEVWEGLAAIRFDGYLMLESFAAINPDLAAATCLWRPPQQSSDEIARDGLAFLRAGAEKYGLP
jgi:D-psicose/D-tagatose/L-ribulose 3-epimerase